MEEFEFISPIPEERYHDVIIHLRNNFFADEPLNKSLGLCKQGEPHAELEIHSLNTLGDQLSVMAVCRDTDEVSCSVPFSKKLKIGQLPFYAMSFKSVLCLCVTMLVLVVF